jgi:hypothetical protein
MPNSLKESHLVAEHDGWKIYEQTYFGWLKPRYIATNDGQVESGASIEEVVEQITSRVGELSKKEGAWSAGICDNN